jgi:hypothetical protein
MSDTDTAVETDPYRGRWGIDQRTWAVIYILLVFAAVAAVLLGLVTWVGSVRDANRGDLASDLFQQYGATIELPNTRIDQPGVWIIDGVDRNCFYVDDTLKCLDGDGAYTEIGNAE